MKVEIVIDQNELKKMILEKLRRTTGLDNISERDISIQTKSTQNYKSEWEGGAGFRAFFSKSW